MSILKDVSQAYLEDFLESLNEPVKNKSIGICVNYLVSMRKRQSVICELLMIECCKELYCFSGSKMYPIGDDEADAANKYRHINNLWDERTNYGKLRHSVLNLMKDKVSKELSLRNSGVE